MTDEELPDYIMVMVANKRSREQMDDDLQLFLGSNTEEFTGWLHQVLQKLQEVTVASLGESCAFSDTQHFRAEGVETSLHIRCWLSIWAVHIKCYWGVTTLRHQMVTVNVIHVLMMLMAFCVGNPDFAH